MKPPVQLKTLDYDQDCDSYLKAAKQMLVMECPQVPQMFQGDDSYPGSRSYLYVPAEVNSLRLGLR